MSTNEKNCQATDKLKESGPKKKWGLPFWAVFLICAWMFFLGVLVGRGTSPVSFDIHELEKQIADLKKAELKSEDTGIPINNPLSMDINPDLDFYKELKVPDKNVPVPNIKPKSKIIVRSEKVSDSTRLNTHTRPSTSEPEKQTEKPNTPIPELEKQTENPLKIYSIQIASLRDPVEANRMVELLKNKGYPAYRVSAEIKNTGLWHRVRIGPFKTQSEAFRVLTRVYQENRGAMILEHEP